MQLSIMIVLVLTMCFAGIAYALEGTATFYNRPYTPSACFGNEDHGRLVAGVSNELWNNGAACGRTIGVMCTGATNLAPQSCIKGIDIAVVVEITDHSPKCSSTINLSEDAFSVIANPDAGRIRIEYDE
ncbi:Expansin [Trema orientale]|uniref:Expansin n=1 Tax=Trema orientale TaxID=63057 RepID=A0A2P5BBC6_TREOI|nr:Expansin [Trema orientale]